MRLFLSYRRDDTAGRAGRLFDGLTQRLGAGSVFQDVASISPGVDFEDAVGTALARTDVSIVVIGSEWTTLVGADGTRRLDHADDYVRREVAAALESGRPVVPVLVGESRMPETDELPDELRPLLTRQAFTVRDVAWNDDVDGLVRRLRTEVAPGGHRRRLAAVAAAVVALLLVGGGVAVALWPADDEQPGTAVSATPCAMTDESSWSTLGVAAEPLGSLTLTDGTNRRISYRVTAVRARQRQSNWRTLVDVEVSNQTTPVTSTSEGDWYVDANDFRRLVVDGVPGDEPSCFNLLTGAQSIPPGQRATVRVGFDVPADPRQSELVLETTGTPIPVAANRT
jgi:hypothetical protein